MNGGECESGVCICPEGWVGTYCEVEDTACAGVTCFNGGICRYGFCDCPAGYEGPTCASRTSARYSGVFIATEACDISGTFDYTVWVYETTNPTIVEFENLYNYGQITAAYIIDASRFDIPSQNMAGLNITGSGTLNTSNDEIVLNYNLTFPDGEVGICNVVMIRY